MQKLIHDEMIQNGDPTLYEGIPVLPAIRGNVEKSCSLPGGDKFGRLGKAFSVHQVWPVKPRFSQTVEQTTTACFFPYGHLFGNRFPSAPVQDSLSSRNRCRGNRHQPEMRSMMSRGKAANRFKLVSHDLLFEHQFVLPNVSG